MKNKTRKTSAMVMAAAMMMTAALTGCSGNSAETKAAAATTAPAADAGTAAAAGTVSADVQKIIDAGKLVVGCKVDVPNFSLQNTATGKYEGVEDDLAYLIAGKIFGCTAEEAKAKDLIEFKGVNAKTRGPLLDNGEVDLVIATFTITPERKETWNFSSAYYTDAVGLLVLKDSGIASIADLDKKVIGVSRGSTSEKGLMAYAKDQGINVTPSFEEFDTYPELAAALSSKNIDVFCVDRAILSGYTDDTNTLLPDRFAEQEYGVASKKDNT
ncbi:MAG: transporter substrate-binding domain-containing protein, partial [Hungatella sp.]